MNLILKTAYTSLVFQIVLGIIGIHGIFIKLQEKDSILTHIMIMETIVQFIELSFYIWIIMHLSKISYEVTFVRYFDWFITTPIMLISTIFFMKYLNLRGKTIVNIDYMYQNNFFDILLIFISNLVMLIFGFLSELKIISRPIGFTFGTIAFAYSFYIIYSEFVGSNITNLILFLFLLIIWFFYGIAFLFPYVTKNTMYNFLDIISKNFYGLFIYYNILKAANFI